MSDPIYKAVTITVLDTDTGETRTDATHTPWHWAKVRRKKFAP